MTPDQLAVKTEFDRLINMSAEAMTTWFASPESEWASLPAPIAKRMKQKSGKLLGKAALVLKQKEAWTDTDFAEARGCTTAIKRFLGRRVAYKTAEGKWTPFAVSLLNRGHDPSLAAPIPLGASGEPAVGAEVPTVAAEGLTTDTLQRELGASLRRYFEELMGGAMPEDMNGPWLRYDGIFLSPPRAIFEWQGALFQMSFSFDTEGHVTLAPESLVEVTMEPVPVSEPDDVASGEILEVSATEAAGEGPKWSGFMIKAGAAKNKGPNGLPREYTAEALEAAVAEGLFDDVPGFDRTDVEHSKREGAEIVGYWGKAVWDKAAKAVRNTFTWLEGKMPKAVNGKVKAAVAEGKTADVPGFSVVVDILVPKQTPHIVAAIEKVLSCDPVAFPSAGGQVLKVTESHIKEQHMKILDALKAKGMTVPAKLAALWEKIEVSEGAAAEFMLAQLKEKRPKMFEKMPDLEQKLTKDETMLVTIFSEFMEAEGVQVVDPQPNDDKAAQAAATEAARIAQQAAEALARVNAFALEGMLAQSGLDAHGLKLVRARLDGTSFDPQKVTEAITDVKDTLAAIRVSMTPRHLVSAGMDQQDKVAQAWNDMLFYDVHNPTERAAVSESVTGQTDRNGRKLVGLSGHVGREIFSIRRLAEMSLGRQINWYDRQEVQEAMDSVVSAAHLVNGMNLKVAYRFNLESEYRDMFRVANVVPVGDMKTKYTLATGSLDGWAAKHATNGFPTLTASGAAKESYTPTEYGGIHNITWIEFVNDDTSYFQQIPNMISDEALFALNDFFWGTLVAANPTLTDTSAVFAAGRGNYMSSPLEDETLTDAIGKLQQTQHPGKSSGRPRMTRAKFLAVTSSVAMQKKAYALTTLAAGQQNQVASFAQARGLQVLVNTVSSDLNDWWLFGGDPAGIVEIGIYGGRVEPVITIANDPGVGRRFTHNEIQVKGDQSYGGNWVTPKNAVWSQVAS